MKKILFLLILTLIISCKSTKTQNTTGFSLKGETHDIEDGTKLLLLNLETDIIIDSTLVQNNKFEFSTVLPSFPFQTVLYTEGFAKYRFMWLENKPMTFDAKNTSFLEAPTTGSVTDKLVHDFFLEREKLPRDEQENLTIEFIKTHPNSIASASMLSIYTKSWGKNLTKQLFENFSTENKESTYGQNISKFINLNKNPIIGEKFVDFEMENQDREIERLSDFRNKTVLLEFWGSGCGPCRKENPNLVKTYKQFHPKGFEIFAVSLDNNKDKWLKAIKEDNLPWHQVCDLKGSGNMAAMIYGVSSIPDNFLIDKNGIIIARGLRGNDLDKKLAETLE